MGDMAKILSVRFSETSMVIVLKAVASSAQNFLYIMILKKSNSYTNEEQCYADRHKSQTRVV